MGLFDSFKKKNNSEEINLAPNLMAADPAANGNVNLMTPDPINAMPEINVLEPTMPIAEQPGIENQIMQAPISPSEIPMTNNPEPTPMMSSLNAFDMSLPVQEEAAGAEVLPSEPIIASQTETLDDPPVNNKFCPECGTPNDLLNKFCVSCGKAIE